MKRCWTDWRSPGRWSRADRSRPQDGDRASVSNQWPTNPCGIRDVEVLVAVQPGVHRWGGEPSGTPESFNATWGELVDQNGWTLYDPVTGEPVHLWTSDPQSVTAFDLTDEKARTAWADTMLDHYLWPAGFHLDYFSTFETLHFPPDFWPRWFAGWRDVVTRLRSARPGILLLGQEYHETPLTDDVPLFVEIHPQAFGITLYQHQQILHRATRPKDFVYEMRNPERLPAWYLQQCLAFIEQNECFVSWRRDQFSGIGLP